MTNPSLPLLPGIEPTSSEAAPVDLSSAVPARFASLRDLSLPDIERRVAAYRNTRPELLTDEQLTEVVALHRIAMMKTAGPARAKPTRPAAKSLDDLAAGFE